MFKRIATAALVAGFMVTGLAAPASAGPHDDGHGRRHHNSYRGHHADFRGWRGCSGWSYVVVTKSQVIVVSNKWEADRLARKLRGEVEIVKARSFC